MHASGKVWLQSPANDLCTQHATQGLATDELQFVTARIEKSFSLYIFVTIVVLILEK